MTISAFSYFWTVYVMQTGYFIHEYAILAFN